MDWWEWLILLSIVAGIVATAFKGVMHYQGTTRAALRLSQPRLVPMQDRQQEIHNRFREETGHVSTVIMRKGASYNPDQDWTNGADYETSYTHEGRKPDGPAPTQRRRSYEGE